MLFLVVVGSLVLFVVSEKTPLHFSRTARRAFWYLLSCALFLWLVRWMQSLETLGHLWIMITAVVAASVVEDEYRKKTGLTPMDIEATRALRMRCRSPVGQGHSERIMDIVNAITRGKGYTAGTKQLVSRVSGATKKWQRGLHRILQVASKDELNFIICSVNVAAVLEVANDKTIKMLVGRCDILETVSRAAIVDGLQKIGLRHRWQRQEWARDIILRTTGVQLTYFKAYIDDGGDYHSMYKLMYNDLQWEIREQVEKHIRVQAEGLMRQMRALEIQGPKPPGIVLKILSDVDDTVFSSGGSFPAGVDVRYPRKSYYPGVLALYSAMDRHFARKFGHLLSMLDGGSLATLRNEALNEGDSGVGGVGGVGGDISGDISGETDVSLAAGVAISSNSNEVNVDTGDGTNRTPTIQVPKQSRHMPPASSMPSLRIPVSSLTSLAPPPSPEYFMLGDLRTPREGAYSLAAMNKVGALGAAPAHQEGSNLVLLSARPESYKGLTESESYRKYFEPLVIRGDLDTSPTMLLGSLDSGPKALIKLFFGSSDQFKSKTATDALYQQLATKKLSRFKEYAALYPEATFVYVGDNGQGDVLCAEALANNRDIRSRLMACFIHKVASAMSTLSIFRKHESSSEDIQLLWREKGIHLKKTHLGMARTAYELNLIGIDDLRKIAHSAVGEFSRIAARYEGRHPGRHLEKVAKQDLNPDIFLINSTLKAKGFHSRSLVPLVAVDSFSRDEATFQNRSSDGGPTESGDYMMMD
mmetsp:Transcript_5540/g.15669  ORF Transcript_5540/g.15669 Transcript_5540/m.15669 type:complete len:757 (+) Transcript_5540:1428-3698(+)